MQTLSAQLTEDYGQGFGRANLFQMVRLAELFPDPEIVSALSKQLSWSHFVQILPLKDALKRDFYAELCRAERWTVRTLRHKIGHLLYERTAVSKKPDELIAQDLAALRDEDRMTPDLVFRDPYFLTFLGLTDPYAEKDVEQAILRELESFILELGSDFAFVARQKRVTESSRCTPPTTPSSGSGLRIVRRRDGELEHQERRPIRVQSPQQGKCDIVDRNAPGGAAFRAAVVGMTVHRGRDGITIKRLFETPAAQEGKDLGRLVLDRRADRCVVEHGDSARSAQPCECRL